MEKKNFLLLNTPSSIRQGIPAALSILSGQLEYNNISVDAIDLNIEFYNDLLNKEYLENVLSELDKRYLDICKKTDNENLSNNINDTAFLADYKTKIEEILNKKDIIIKDVINNVEQAKYILRNIKSINDISYMKINKIIEMSLYLISLLYYPSILTLYGYILKNKFENKLNYDSIKEIAFAREQNIFIDYFEQKMNALLKTEYDVISLSVCTSQQLPAAFTLSRLLKEKTKSKILLGGNIFGLVKENILKYPEIFDIFCDEILVGDGEKTIIDYYNCIKGEITPKDVAGLMYKDGQDIIFNPPKPIEDIENIFPPSVKNLDLNKYLSIGPVMDLQFTKGCYWHKCAFCSAYQDRNFYQIVRPDKAADIVESLNKNHNIDKFYIIDDALTPIFIENFAKELIKRNLDIKYNVFLRLEKSYTYSFFKLLKKSGLTSVYWGYEAASERIMKLINKGIDINSRTKIIKDASKAGLYNIVSFIIGFPTETEKEMEQTINYYLKHKDIIDEASINMFAIAKCSIMMNSLDKYRIKKINNIDEEFETLYYSFDADGTDFNAIQKHLNKFVELTDRHNSLINKNFRERVI